MEQVLEAALAAIDQGAGAALVTPVVTTGSLPTGRQARLLVRADGASEGTVGGGRMEADAQAAARAAIGSGQAALLTVSLTAQDALADGLLCGGQATFLVEPLGPGSRPALAHLLRLSHDGLPAVEALRLHDGQVRRRIATADGDAVGSLGDAALDAAAQQQVERILDDDTHEALALPDAGGEATVYVQARRRHPVLYLFGAGHVGLAVGQVAPLAGFRLVVVDDRAEFANRERFPHAEAVHVRPFAQALDGLPVDDGAYVVVMTRGHQWDRQVVAQALRTRAAYIGMIGSRRKVAATFDALRAESFTDADLARVRAPIGLDLGGDSPGEIAVSVVAQLIQVRCGRG